MRLVSCAKHAIYGITFIIALFLTITSFLYFIDIQNMEIQKDSFLLNILAVSILVILMEFLYKYFSGKIRFFNKILLYAVLIYSAAIGLFWIINSRSLPSGDQQSIYDIALSASGGDLLPVAPTGSYLSLWPFQSGLVLIYEVILRLIPNAHHLTIQASNLPFILLMIVSGYHLVKKWFNNDRAVTYFLILIPLCLPLYLYSNFMYGDLPSLALMFFSAWMLTEYKVRSQVRYVLLAAFSVILAVVYRTNSIIFVIACLIILSLEFLIERRKKDLFVCLLLLLAVVLANKFPKALYEYRAGNTMGDGVPALAYIAMGMQHNGNTAGWWNGYHSNLYVALDYNTSLTAEYSLQSIKDSLSSFAEAPGYALSFYYKKLVTQWCDENYSCFHSTKIVSKNRTELAWAVYEGEFHEAILNIMNWYQSAVYLGFLLYCFIPLISRIRRRYSNISILYKHQENFESSLFLVTIIGGFLFSILWEGGSRYVFPYTVMMLPYAAMGYSGFMSALRTNFVSLLHVLGRGIELRYEK